MAKYYLEYNRNWTFIYYNVEGKGYINHIDKVVEIIRIYHHVEEKVYKLQTKVLLNPHAMVYLYCLLSQLFSNCRLLPELQVASGVI